MKPAGYLVNNKTGLVGEHGAWFDYVLASNGLFIEAENELMTARIPVAKCEVRGLAPLEARVVLTYGSIPRRFFDLALDMFLADVNIEHYVAVTGQAGYQFYVPVQEKGAGRVVYDCGDNVVLDLHSHGRGRAWFSLQDNTDETGLRLYGVIGSLDRTPVIKLRAGIYGYFYPLAWNDVFDGTLTNALEFEREEVINENELQSFPEDDGGRFGLNSGGLWWHRWLRR